MTQGITLSKLLQWSYDHGLEIRLEFGNEGLNAKSKRTTKITFIKNSRTITHTLYSLSDKDELSFFAKQAAIKLLIKDLVI